jgi:hypothetical protein
MRESEFRRFLRRQEAREAGKKEQEKIDVWVVVKGAKKWAIFLLVNALLTNRNR